MAAAAASRSRCAGCGCHDPRPPFKSRRAAERRTGPARPADEHRHGHGVQLVQSALRTVDATRRGGCMREGKGTAPRSRRSLRCPARHAGAGGPTAGDERQASQPVGAQLVEHRRPGDVELVRRSRGTASRDAVGLLLRAQRRALLERHVSVPPRDRATHAATGPVPHDQNSARASSDG